MSDNSELVQAALARAAMEMEATAWANTARPFKGNGDHVPDFEEGGNYAGTASELRDGFMERTLNPEATLGGWFGSEQGVTLEEYHTPNRRGEQRASSTVRGMRPPLSPPKDGEGVVWLHGSAFPLIVQAQVWREALAAEGLTPEQFEAWGVPSGEKVAWPTGAERWTPSEPMVDWADWHSFDEPDPEPESAPVTAAERAECREAVRRWSASQRRK